MRFKLLAVVLCAICGTVATAHADDYLIAYGIEAPLPGAELIEAPVAAAELIEPTEPLTPIYALPIEEPLPAEPEPAYEDGFDVFTYKEEIDGEPAQQPSYLEDLISEDELDAAGAESNCRPGRVFGCRDNGCASIYPNEKQCTVVQRLATGTECPYTFKASASFCDSDHDCRCNVIKSVAIARYYLALGCPEAGRQTVSCTPV